MRKLLVPIVILAVLMFSACTTSRGASFSAVRSRSANGETAAVEEKPLYHSGENTASGNDSFVTETKRIVKQTASDGQKAPSAVLEVNTKPSGAEVFLNYRSLGESPVLVRDIEPGTYYLTVSRRGYYEESRWVTIREGVHLVVGIELRLITGFLSLSVDPPDATVLVDGERVRSGVRELPVGRHDLTVRKFGYTEKTRSFVIGRRRTTEISIRLDEADFSISDIRFSRERLNPENPGKLGEMDISFRVSAPGSAEAEIVAPDGNVVYVKRFSDFSRWKQEFPWEGMTERGEPLPDGEYTVRISGSGNRRGEFSSVSGSFTLDRTAVIRFRSGLSGIAGLLYAPSPDILPAGSFQLTAAVIGHRERSDNYLWIPSQIFGRVGINKRIELDLSGLLVFTSSGTDGFTVSAGGKYRITSNPERDGFHSAFTLKGTYSSLTEIDTFTNYPSLSLGMPLGFSLGALRLYLSPELLLSPYYPAYNGTDNSGPAFPPYFFGYLRAGIGLDFGSLTTGFSLALRSRPLSEGLDLSLPLQAGFELQWLVPGTLIFLTFEAAGEFSDAENYFLMSGGGIGFVF